MNSSDVAAPEILFVPDLSSLLGYGDPSATRRAVHRGDVGPYFYVGRRLAVLRASLMEALREKQISPARSGSPRQDGLEPYRKLLSDPARKGKRHGR